jgi:mRNA-degrading endonuclease RelE of RelBE toxin-antitoxin system
MKNSIYHVLFHPKAEAEFLESVDWYNNSLTGLGEEFIFEIENIITRICKNPFLFPVKLENIRQAVVYKFPFVIVYQIRPEQHLVVILAVYHTSRNPKNKIR